MRFSNTNPNPNPNLNVTFDPQTCVESHYGASQATCSTGGPVLSVVGSESTYMREVGLTGDKT